MLYKSSLTTSASGSIDGMTASHNRGGRYLRARAIPADPNTAGQQAVRTAMAGLADDFVNLLTDAQRAAWATYASNVPLVGPLGDPRDVGAMGMYVRSNLPRIRAAATQIDDAPIIFTEGSLAAITVAATALANGLSIAFDDGAAWVDEDDAHMIVQVGQPVNASKNFYKAPFVFAGTIDGDGTTAPTSPTVVTSPINLEVGQKIFVRARLSRADGRLSPAQIVDDIVA